MKTFQYTLLTLLSFLVLASGCKKTFETDSKNTNLATQVPPSLILRSVLKDLYTGSGDRNYLPFSQAERENQFTCSNYGYYGDNTYWSGSATLDYATLNNIASMEKEAARLAGTTATPYHAVGKFLKAWFYIDMTMKVGDLPFSSALKNLQNTSPAYDLQKTVFLESLKLLDSSNTQLAALIKSGLGEFSGDFFHTEGTQSLSATSALVAWQKVVNSFRLRTLIQLSKQTGDADLKVASQFAQIFGNPTTYPVLSGNADNLQLVFNTSFDFYPNNPLNFGNDATRYNMGATYLNTAAGLNDLRAMIVAEPARGLGFADTAYASFVGSPSGAELGSIAAGIQSGNYSLIGRHRYYETLNGEPYILLGYPELCFNIAEAMNRGWVTGTAEDWYKKGIQSSLSFYGIKDGANPVVFQKAGGLLGQNVTFSKFFTFSGYYAQPSVQYSSNVATALNQVLIQKYLAFFRNSGLEAYYQYRRTGVPAFSIGVGNGNSSRIPTRFQYPTSEQNTNAANYKIAVQRQFGGSDDIFQTLWLLK